MHRRIVGPVEGMSKGSTMTLAGEVPIAVFRTDDGSYYATSDSCTHENWSLGTDGDLDGTEVICPLHMARFDVVTGEATCFPASIGLRSYQVEIVDGVVYVIV